MADIIKFGPCATIKGYGYMTKKVGGSYIDIPRDSTVGIALERELIIKGAKGIADNHVVYEIKDPYNPPIYVLVTNDTIRIGNYMTDWK